MLPPGEREGDTRRGAGAQDLESHVLYQLSQGFFCYLYLMNMSTCQINHETFDVEETLCLDYICPRYLHGLFPIRMGFCGTAYFFVIVRPLSVLFFSLPSEELFKMLRWVSLRLNKNERISWSRTPGWTNRKRHHLSR
ncbi:hypothetical protein PRBEI_2000924100 [Prionailurus iriomotensis]